MATISFDGSKNEESFENSDSNNNYDNNDNNSNVNLSETHDLNYYVENINEYLNIDSSDEPSQDVRLQFAIRLLKRALGFYPNAFDLKFLAHKISIREGDMTQAMKQLDELRTFYPDNETLRDYLVQITYSVRHRIDDDNFKFFLRVPSRTQVEILVHAAVYYENKSEILDACRLYILILKVYPDTVNLYGTHAAELAIQCENENFPLPIVNTFRKILVEEVLSVILHQKIIIIHKNTSGFSESQYPIQPSNTSILHSTSQQPSTLQITYDNLKTWLERAQGYYIASKEWRRLFEVSLAVMSSCGYIKLESSPQITIINLFEDQFKLPEKLFKLLNEKQLSFYNNRGIGECMRTTFPFAVSIGIACFVYCCNQFYELVAGSKSITIDKCGTGKRDCLIPIYPLTTIQQSPISSSYAHHLPINEISKLQHASKKRKIGFIISEETDSKNNKIPLSSHDDEITKVNFSRNISIMDVKNLLIDDDDGDDDKSKYPSKNCQTKNVDIPINSDKLKRPQNTNTNHDKELMHTLSSLNDKAMSLLKCSLDCRSLLEQLITNSDASKTKAIDQEIDTFTKSWCLSLDDLNALMLTRADIALSLGDLNTAYSIYRDICGQFSGAWDAHRNRKLNKKKRPYIPLSSPLSSPPLSSPPSSSSPSTPSSPELPTSTDATFVKDSIECSIVNVDSGIKPQTPLILTFRVLYTIAILYLLVGSYHEAKMELLIILATIPFAPVTHEHFEKDDWIISNSDVDGGNDRNNSNDSGNNSRNFVFMVVSESGLIVRAIKELMGCYEKELNLPSQIPNDYNNILGNMIVLMQYGWPYWRDRLFRPVVLRKIEELDGLKYPNLLRFVSNTDILKELYDLYKKNPSIIYYCLVSSSSSDNETTRSIKALKEKIDNGSIYYDNVNNDDKKNSLMEFCKAKLVETGKDPERSCERRNEMKVNNHNNSGDNGNNYRNNNSDSNIIKDNNNSIACNVNKMNTSNNNDNSNPASFVSTKKNWKMAVSSIIVSDDITTITNTTNNDNDHNISIGSPIIIIPRE